MSARNEYSVEQLKQSILDVLSEIGGQPASSSEGVSRLAQILTAFLNNGLSEKEARKKIENAAIIPLVTALSGQSISLRGGNQISVGDISESGTIAIGDGARAIKNIRVNIYPSDRDHNRDQPFFFALVVIVALVVLAIIVLVVISKTSKSDQTPIPLASPNGGVTLTAPQLVPSVTPAATNPLPSLTPAATNVPVLTAAPISCLYQGDSDERTLRNLIDAEGRAATSQDTGVGLGIISDIFAPNAVIEQMDIGRTWSNPIAYYQELLDRTNFTTATHTDVQPAPNPLEHGRWYTADTAWFTSGSQVTGTDGGTPVVYKNDPPSDHWTFGKDQRGCWRITKFVFNASHIPFPP